MIKRGCKRVNLDLEEDVLEVVRKRANDNYRSVMGELRLLVDIALKAVAETEDGTVEE